MSWQSEKAHGEEIAYQLAPLGNVTVVRFFSGAAMRLDGVMFGFMSRGSLFLRVDDVNRPAFVAAGMGPFSYERPTRTVSLDGYYEAPADVLEDAGALFDWCRSAYRAALLAGPPKRKARAVSKAKPVQEAKQASKRAAKPVSKVSSKPVPVQEAKRVAKPVSKTSPKSAPAQEAKPTSKRTTKPASKASPESAPAQEAKQVSKRVTKPASKASPKPVPVREAKPTSKPATKSPTKRKQT
ncbi:competence protein TfoX [Burkholderia lata]|uniref:Competence protein TfoX n=2 Tax=Burkholderia lata (strain ATCC 17760 / DSM 23089 / LMG 22485 / NCIMB 9086 / R18194 / 383) TaxID=482957 RepID=A0A6P2R5Z7_BURL3|nr:competence protein TfoX [Burkholderia lata]